MTMNSTEPPGKIRPIFMNILLLKAILPKMEVRGLRLTRGVILSVLVIIILQLRCNDVERNPGPDDHLDSKFCELSRQLQSAMQIMTEVRQQNVIMERHSVIKP